MRLGRLAVNNGENQKRVITSRLVVEVDYSRSWMVAAIVKMKVAHHGRTCQLMYGAD